MHYSPGGAGAGGTASGMPPTVRLNGSRLFEHWPHAKPLRQWTLESGGGPLHPLDPSLDPSRTSHPTPSPAPSLCLPVGPVWPGPCRDAGLVSATASEGVLPASRTASHGPQLLWPPQILFCGPAPDPMPMLDPRFGALEGLCLALPVVWLCLKFVAGRMRKGKVLHPCSGDQPPPPPSPPGARRR